MNPFGVFLGGALVASIISACGVALAFSRPAMSFLFGKFEINPVNYATHLAAGIWLCSIATILSQIVGVLILFGVTTSPVGANPRLFAVVLAAIAFLLYVFGYGLHMISLHAVRRSKPDHFATLWGAIVTVIALATIFILWKLRVSIA